jgi:hypothetical protein
MEIPEDVLAIIKEFTRPITRPGWRKLNKMLSLKFHSAIVQKYNTRHRTQVIYNFVREYTRRPQDIYKYSFSNSYIDWNGNNVLVTLMKN